MKGKAQLLVCRNGDVQKKSITDLISFLEGRKADRRSSCYSTNRIIAIKS
jgi:hypothetical protein